MFNFLQDKDSIFIPKFQAMKKILALLVISFGLNLDAQNTQGPNFEIGLGYALKHTEGFGIPKAYVGVNNLYNGIGAYVSPEYRRNITFLEDGTNYYFRIPMGLTFEINENVACFAGADPISFAQGKNLRKELGLAFYTGPLTIRTGYSYWVGATIGVGYRFGSNPDALSFQVRKPRKNQSSGLAIAKKQPEPQIIERIDTVIVKEEVIKEVVKEVVKEVEKPTELTQIAVLYFEFNTTSYTRESQLQLEALATVVKENPAGDIVIIGHTDEVGTDAYNYTLGLNRAQKVANFLVNTRGIEASRIEVRSEGMESPETVGSPEKNRRVVVYFKK